MAPGVWHYQFSTQRMLLQLVLERGGPTGIQFMGMQQKHAHALQDTERYACYYTDTGGRHVHREAHHLMPSGVLKARARRSSLTLPRPYRASLVVPFFSRSGSICRVPTVEPVSGCRGTATHDTLTALTGLLAYLHHYHVVRGHLGHAGWRWCLKFKLPMMERCLLRGRLPQAAQLLTTSSKMSRPS